MLDHASYEECPTYGGVLLAEGLDRPTSLEIINNTAYIVTLGG
jgi:hypothetical protein